MTNEPRDPEDDLEGASAPEASLVARQAAATTGSSIEAPGTDSTPSSDRVDARGATLGRESGDGDLGEQASTSNDLADDPANDPIEGA